MKRLALVASLCAALAFPSLSPAARAQDSCPAGFGFGSPHAIGPFDAYATLQDGTRVVSDGLSVDHVDANGALSGSDTNGCLLQGHVSVARGASVAEVTHAVTGCGMRDGRYRGLAAALVDRTTGAQALLLATSNTDSAIGWRLTR